MNTMIAIAPEVSYGAPTPGEADYDALLCGVR